jgi:hypothetical protein
MLQIRACQRQAVEVLEPPDPLQISWCYLRPDFEPAQCGSTLNLAHRFIAMPFPFKEENIIRSACVRNTEQDLPLRRCEVKSAIVFVAWDMQPTG